jgi:hypothetical protein
MSAGFVCKASEASLPVGATDGRCQAACQYIAPGAWPCGRLELGHPCHCNGATTSSSTTTSTTSTTPKSGGREPCVANEAANRGVSDSNCAQCPLGYQWWPCNEATLCKGDCTP